MTTTAYLAGRQRYQRPQAVMFSETPGTLDTTTGSYVPDGMEMQAAGLGIPEDLKYFLILSDHNRQPLDVKPIRIEQRQRTINGKMRSVHVADKKSITISWDMLPSRAFHTSPDFDIDSGATATNVLEYTADGGAGGVELLDWYENHVGSFYVFLSYDKYNEFITGQPSGVSRYNHLAQYSEVLEMFITDFSYSIQKRGATNYDLWNISITLEEA